MTKQRFCTRTRFTISAAVGMLLSLTAIAALAAPPAAPVVTTSADIKQLHFDWDIVPRSNYYEFWFKANISVPYVKFSEQRPWQPHATNNIAAHLLDWDQARYQVRACNFSGCAASPDIAVKDRMFESIGYFKPGSAYADAGFGASAAISEDGQTLAAFASNEPVPGGGIAVVYVFARVNGAWQQQKRIIPSTTIPDRHNFGGYNAVPPALSLSADGNRLMTGLGVCNQRDAPGRFCYLMLSVWNRSGSTWTREFQTVTESPFYSNDPAQMNEAGDRILDGSATVPGLYERTSSGWGKHAPLPPVLSGDACLFARLSGDGNSLARVCSISAISVRLLIAKAPDWKVAQNFVLPWPDEHVYGGFAIDYAGTTLALASSIFTADSYPPDVRPQVQVLKIANGALTTSVLRAESWAPAEYSSFGYQLALSRDGGLLAVYNPTDRGAGHGVLSPPLQAGTSTPSATNIYELRASGPRLRRVIKPPTTGSTYITYFQQFAFANNGRTLLITNPDDPSGATGIDGDRNDRSVFRAGALWLY